jgi:hypothetical protein
LRSLFSLTFENNELHKVEPTMRQVKRIYEGKGRGAQLASAKGIAFGLLNAVTQL